MKRPITLCSMLALALAAPALATDGAKREAPPPADTIFAATAQHTEGEAAFGFGGSVVVDLRDVPTGDPDAVAGLLRGHEQGDFRGEPQPDYFSGVPELDAGAVFGPAPEPVSESFVPNVPNAPGDLLRNFTGQGASGWLPPDPVLAVGPRHVLEVVNSGFTVFSKDGGLERAYTDLETFFAPIRASTTIPCTNANCFVFDPRVIYSQWHSKFVLFALGRDDVNQRSYLFFAISQTNNPLGAWWQYYGSDPGGNDAWIDYSGLTADPEGVYFTGNEFFWAGGFKHSIIFSVRPSVFTGSWTGAWIFTGLTWDEPGNPEVFEIQPAVPTHGYTGDAATFFVNTFNSSGNKFCLWKMTGDRGSSPTLVRGDGTVSAYADPGLARQPAPGADDIEMFYAGAQNVAYSQRNVYVALNDAGTNQSGFYVSKFNVDSLTEARNITYYTGDLYYYYPNVALVGNDTTPMVGVSSTYSGDAQNASAAVKLYENFLTDSTGAFIGVRSGVSTYNVYFNGRNRWGDYLGSVRDATCDNLWTVTQYVSSFNNWGTQISAVAGPTAPTGICRLIFDDSFERGSTANWSSTI